MDKNYYYHATGSLFNVNDEIPPGNWGAEIAKYPSDRKSASAFITVYRETVLENYREKYFIDKPSRLNCIYLCESHQATREFIDSAPGRERDHIYKVEIVNNQYKLHRGDYNLVTSCWDKSKYLQECMELMTKEYWGTQDPKNNVEILVDSPVRVVDIIS